MKSIIFIDSEIGLSDHKIKDLGALKEDGVQFHSASQKGFMSFIADTDFLCGHNIVEHDMKYLAPLFNNKPIPQLIDTLYLSPLLYPKKPYHKLPKNEKLDEEQLNNPLNDAIKAQIRFYEEQDAWRILPRNIKMIYCALLYGFTQFNGFFDYNGYKPFKITGEIIKAEFDGKICKNADIDLLIEHYPIELAYALALISSNDYQSITPPWLIKNYPKIENVIKFLCASPCNDASCIYCTNKLDVKKGLKRFFGFDSFRTYNGEPLQENAARAAIEGKSLLAVFPTGGGKSITFQLPALMQGESTHGLTVVISPLLSLMKDQVDNLNEKGLYDAVTINGLLSPIERKEAIERVSNGKATLLYIAPEQLRSKTIERILFSRNVVRFVIDEAHCFSAWGQDFRVDYQYIGDFIRGYQRKKLLKKPIPVSCFTATAKQKVITDIKDYFKRKLDLNLELYATSATRANLHYTVLHVENDDEKYNMLRSLIERNDCPTIIYVSRTRRTLQLAAKLTADGFPARPFNGKMDANIKIENQEAFIRNEYKIIVATSAFGMGVDKKDVKLVIHYDISDSLENYVQEAGRAGRDEHLQAECYVLFNDEDLNKHFILLNQTKLSISEIQQVWKAIKDLTKTRPNVCCSPLEIARQAGWDDSKQEIETRVKTAISALESAGYVKRGNNSPRVYATSILAKNMDDASQIIRRSSILNEGHKQDALRIMHSLIHERAVEKGEDAESRVDYLADRLGLEKSRVIDSIGQLRELGLLADHQDMSAYINRSDTEYRSSRVLDNFAKLEFYLLSNLPDEGLSVDLKQLNDQALKDGINFSTIKNIKTIHYFWNIKGYTSRGVTQIDDEDKPVSRQKEIVPTMSVPKLKAKFENRIEVCKYIIKELYQRAESLPNRESGNVPVLFSLLELHKGYLDQAQISFLRNDVTIVDVEDALLYLNKIGALQLEGGFLVLYNGMELKRIVIDNKIRYKQDDYRLLSEFYKLRIQQIHIVGEYANLMVRDYNMALQFVHDYFNMDYRKFILHYFKGNRAKEIERNITPDKYNQLFGNLSDKQREIIDDDEAKHIVVAAGPGSGKTRVLVHKLASLMLMEDVKHEQLLMVTFSRAAATVFKKRLLELIHNAAHFLEVKTFHSYCFDLLGKIGTLEDSENVVKDAAAKISEGEVELGRITKTVLVIDEAQDMDENEYALIEALMSRNEDMRVIAVGDDDQNIYEFRGSDSKFMRSLITQHNAALYEMTENYRSKANIVAFSNAFVQTIQNRMKINPNVAVQDDNGIVELVRYSGTNLEVPIVNQIIKNGINGETCVLTTTNEEALKIVGLLYKNGIRATLIQSNDGFYLYNLVEIRMFLKFVNKDEKSPVISEAIWNDAKNKLNTTYANSSCLGLCIRLIIDFEETNSIKYKTDFIEYIRESKIEDFYGNDNSSIIVSTIHKAKGREFDTVYMLLDNSFVNTDENKRKIYVGMTRAKNNLYIHYNTSYFDKFDVENTLRKTDNNQYDEPSEITLQLTHKDVVLNFFKDKKELIFQLHSGMKLSVNGSFLSAEIDNRDINVVKFSKAFEERVIELQSKGYNPTASIIRFVVAWKSEEDEKEYAVILPDISFVK